MSWDNKVVWSEGMFLRPQHFQQHDRYVERLVRDRVTGLRPCPWGLTQLEINRDLLAIGKFAVTSCRGVLPDGTPFHIPEDAPHPPPLDVPDNTRNAIAYLTLPTRQPGGVEVDQAGRPESVARYAVHEFESVDTNAESEVVSLLRIGRLRLRFALETEDRGGFVGIGVARIAEIRSDRNVLLDDAYIPPCLSYMVSPVLAGFLTELQGLLHHRGEALAARLNVGGGRGVAEIADFLLLQAVNGFEPVVAHLASMADLHPERVYSAMLGIAGELATFTARNRRTPGFPVYRHEDLEGTFAPLVAAIRQSLSAVLEQTAIAIPLQERKYGIRVGTIPDRSLLTNAGFVLAVKAAVPDEALRRHFPNQVKIGPVEAIRELVNVALPGIRVRPLPVAPRQIPYHVGVTYFELDRTGEFWKQLTNSGGIAVHVAGEFPQLEMELWAIKG